MRIFLGIVVVVLVLIVARLSVFTVDAGDYAYVTILGRPVATYDGSGDGAGLHVGWPWPVQAVQRVDRRIQGFDLPATEHLTRDLTNNTVDKNLSVVAYAVWRVNGPDAVDRFIKTMGTSERAKSILSSRIIDRLGATLGKMTLDDLINVDAQRVDQKMKELQTTLLDDLQKPLRQDYGIDLIDLRLRRFNYPGETNNSIFARIRSERQKKVTEYQAQGELEARNIESEAEEKYRTLLAQARFEEERLKGEADTQAMIIRNQAHSYDPEFYAFLKKMEKLQSILGDNRTVLLLSTHRPLFDLLFQPPRPQGATPPTAPTVGPPGKGAN